MLKRTAVGGPSIFALTSLLIDVSLVDYHRFPRVVVVTSRRLVSVIHQNSKSMIFVSFFGQIVQ